MVEYKAIIAGDLVPILRHLREGGVISVDSYAGVHMTEELFHATFPEVNEAGHRESTVYPFEFSVTVDGVRFYCISEKAEWEVQE